jgi:hypothetical protein
MKHKCRWLICALLATALAPCAVSQVRGGGFGRGAGFAGHRSRGFGRSAVFFGDPFFYTDYPSGSLTPEMPPSPIFLQRPAAAPEPTRESLLIELQGNRYVRFSGDEQSDRAESAESVTTRSARTLAGSSPIPVAMAARELPPALLIFRDGHQEQVQDYVIAGGTLYARGDYWQSGSWRKDIQLSALDIPATLTANQNRGVKFVLPSGPNEVVTRP